MPQENKKPSHKSKHSKKAFASSSSKSPQMSSQEADDAALAKAMQAKYAIEESQQTTWPASISQEYYDAALAWEMHAQYNSKNVAQRAYTTPSQEADDEVLARAMVQYDNEASPANLSSITSLMQALDVKAQTHGSDNPTVTLLKLFKNIRLRVHAEWMNHRKNNLYIMPNQVQVTLKADEIAEISTILDKNPDVLQLDTDGYNILLEVNHYVERKALSNDFAKRVIDCHNKQMGFKNFDPQSTLYQKLKGAILRSQPDYVRKLLKNESNQSKQILSCIEPVEIGSTGYSLVMRTIMLLIHSLRKNEEVHRAQLKILECLLKNGANPNINRVEDEGRTPLHIAIFSGDVETVEMLLHYGADVNRRGCIYRVMPALYLAWNSDTYNTAKYKNHPEMMALLNKNISAASAGFFAGVKPLDTDYPSQEERNVYTQR